MICRQCWLLVRELVSIESLVVWKGVLRELVGRVEREPWVSGALVQGVKGMVARKRGEVGSETALAINDNNNIRNNIDNIDNGTPLNHQALQSKGRSSAGLHREVTVTMLPRLIRLIEAALGRGDLGLARDLVRAACSLVSGAGEGDEGGVVREAVLSLVGLLRGLTETAFAGPPGPRDKMVGRIGKMLIALQKEQPVFSGSVLAEQLAVFGSHVLESDRYLLAHQEHVVQAMWFLRVCLNAQTYSGCGEAAEAALESFFGPEAQQALLLRNLLCSLLLLRQADLVRWHEDPEGFCDEAENVGDMEMLRPGAEALYLALIEARTDTVVPLVLEFARSFYALSPSGVAEAAVNDACLQALGLGVYYLHDRLDYEAFYAATLAPLLADPRAEAALARRRAVWFVGRWAGEVRQDMFDRVYAAVTALLVDPDRVVSLTAMAALRLLVDEWSFQADLFLPHLELALRSLVALARRAAEPETRVAVLNTVSLVLDRMQDRIGPAAHAVTALIPDLWAFACETDFGLLKTAVVSACAQLVVALGRDAKACYPVALPLLAHAIDLSQPDSVYILDAGLQLWAAVVAYADPGDDPAIQQALLPLFPALAGVISQGFEHLKLATHITEAYVLLYGERFVALHAPSIAAIARSTLGQVREAGAAMLASALDTLLVAAPAEGMRLMLSASSSSSSDSSPTIARTLFRLAFDPTESDLAKSMHAGLLCRMLLTDLPALSAGLQDPQQHQDPLLSLAGQTVALFMCLDIPRKRKLAALALTQLITPATPLDLLSGMVEVVKASLEDEAAANAGPDDPRIYNLGLDAEGSTTALNGEISIMPTELEPLSEKMADLLARDPVILADLQQIATERLQSIGQTALLATE
jgi:hypothetical protein